MAQGPRRTLSKWGSLRPIMLPTWARAELHLAWRSDTEIPALASMQKIARARLAKIENKEGASAQRWLR